MPKLRYLIRFSLRLLLVAFTLLCVVMGLWTYRAKQQQQAVQAFEEYGGEFSYSYQSRSDQTYDPTIEPPIPAWLRNLLGDDYFVTPECLWLSNEEQRSIDDETLARLQDLAFLEELSLFSIKFDDSSIANLRHLTRMRRLIISKCQLGEVNDYSFLSNMVELEWLNISRSDNRFADKDAQHFTRLSRLEGLQLGGSEISDVGMQYVGRLTKLKELSLNGSQVGDEGVALLNGLRNLEVLSLKDTQITDASVPVLSKMSNLMLLQISDTEVTSDGQSRLRNALPGCIVR